MRSRGRSASALAFGVRGGFHPLETRLEFAIGFLQRDFRIGTQETRHVYGGEKQIADFFFQVQ